MALIGLTFKSYANINIIFQFTKFLAHKIKKNENNFYYPHLLNASVYIINQV